MKNTHTHHFKFSMTRLSFSDGHKANDYRAKYAIVGEIYALWSLSIIEQR